MMLSIFLITLILSLGYVPSVSAARCDGFVNALNHIPPDKPGYEKVFSLAQENCGETLDLAALVALYNSTDGDYWTNNEGWLIKDHHCTWYGISCDSSNRVTELILHNNNLVGTLPNELGFLSNLEFLMLSYNHLTGTIPSDLGNLSNLAHLVLYANQLTGPIPSELGNLTNLSYLGLRENHLTGPIPSELGNLTNLSYLLLYANQLEGAIPDSLRNLTNAQYVYLNNNDPSLCVSTTELLDFFYDLLYYDGPDWLCAP